LPEEAPLGLFIAMVDHMKHAQAIKGNNNISLVTSLNFFNSKGVGGIHTVRVTVILDLTSCWPWDVGFGRGLQQQFRRWRMR
jgi:hypothetical protein